MITRLTIFPNGCWSRNENGVYVEPSAPLLFDPLLENKINIELVSEERSIDDNYSHFSYRSHSLSFRSLGVAKSYKNKWRRGLRYIFRLYPVFRAVNASQFCYLFLPSHTGLIAASFCKLLRRPYAIYLRGDIQKLGCSRLWSVYDRFIADSSFVLTTGQQLNEQVQMLNQRSEPVIPMSPVLNLNDEGRVDASRDDKFRILYIGQMVEEKGIFDLLTAFDSVVKKTEQQSELIMVGDGADLNRLKYLIRERDLCDKVRCTGFVSEPDKLVSFYKNASLFVFPSYYPEGFPRVLYEAMRFSVPIITTPVGQVPYLMKDGYDALFTEMRDPDCLAHRINELVIDREWREEISKNGSNTVKGIANEWKNQSHGDQVVAWLKKLGFSA